MTEYTLMIQFVLTVEKHSAAINEFIDKTFGDDNSLDCLDLLGICSEKGMSLTINNYAESLEIEDRGYRVSCLWGDPNCHHKKPYDPTDGHGLTQFSVEAATFGLAIAGTFAIAHGWRP